MVRVMSELVKPLQCIKSESDDELEENEEFAPTPGSESPEPELPRGNGLRNTRPE